MKILKITFAVLFFVFALVQLNDPDPLIWLIVYGAMVVISVMTVLRRYPVRVMTVMAAGYLILTVMHFDGFTDWLASPDRRLLFDDLAKMQYPYIEEAREFLGLLICLFVIIFYFYLAKRDEAK